MGAQKEEINKPNARPGAVRAPQPGIKQQQQQQQQSNKQPPQSNKQPQQFKQSTVRPPNQRPTMQPRTFSTRTPMARRVVTSTQKPKPTTTEVSDDEFFNLLKILDLTAKAKDEEPSKDIKTRLNPVVEVEEKPKNDQMRFSLNVDETGEVNQMYGKSDGKVESNLQERLKNNALKVPPTTHKPAPVINRVVAEKSKKVESNFGPIATTADSPTTKKGPWSHLPPWKQRMLRAARQRQLAARQKAAQQKK